ncbi:hypothetical protein [Actinokineospora sp.]|uniref:hypothetical protein n=1 Tax=Actinokineospora sp. TaxID=1872133 RepID=UPI004037A116
MTDDVKDLLGRAFADEPPLRLDRDAVLADGRRRLRRRRTAAIGGVTAAVAAAVVGATALTGGALGQPDELQPAAPSISTTTTPSLLPTTGVPDSPRTAPPSQILQPPAAASGRLSEVLRAAPIAWPPVITDMKGDARPWYQFDGKGKATADLVTRQGKRSLVVTVTPTAPRDDAIICPGVPSGRPLPNCTRQELPDGGTIRVNVDEPLGGSPASPLSVVVTAARADGTTVTVTETSGTGPQWRTDQIVPTDVLVAIATLPGFSLVG